MAHSAGTRQSIISVYRYPRRLLAMLDDIAITRRVRFTFTPPPEKRRCSLGSMASKKDGNSGNVAARTPSPRVVCLIGSLEDATTKLELISLLNAPTHSSVSETEAVVVAIEERKRLELIQEESRRAQNNGALSSSLAVNHAKQAAVQALIDDYHAVRNKLKISIAEPAGSDRDNNIVAHIRKEKGRIVEQLKRAMNQLLDSSDCYDLRAVVSEENVNITTREQHLREIGELTQEVDMLKKKIELVERSRAVNGKDISKKIKLLKDDLRFLKEDVVNREQDGVDNFRAEHHTRTRTQQLEASALEDQVREWDDAIEREKIAFQMTRKFLKAKTARTQRELHHWTEKFNTEVTAIRKDLQDITDRRHVVHNDLASAQSAHEDEETRLAQRQQAERDLAAKKAREQEAVRQIELFVRQCMMTKAIKANLGKKKEAGKDAKGKAKRK